MRDLSLLKECMFSMSNDSGHAYAMELIETQWPISLMIAT